MKYRNSNSYSVKMTGKEAADIILSGAYVRIVGVVPEDQNLYLTIRHLYDRESSVIRNVWTQEEKIVPWDNIEFA